MGIQNNGTLWTRGDTKMLRSMWREKFSVAKIAKKLKRTETAIFKKATALGLRKPKYHRKPTTDILRPKKLTADEMPRGFVGQDTEETATDIRRIIDDVPVVGRGVVEQQELGVMAETMLEDDALVADETEEIDAEEDEDDVEEETDG